MHAHIVYAALAYNDSQTGQVIIFLINQALQMKSLNYHLLCPMKCHMNGVLIDEVPKFLAPIPSETTYAIQIENPFNATHQIIIPSKSNQVTSYFNKKKTAQEEYEDESILKIELMVEAPPWDLSSPEFSRQEQSIFD